MSDPELSTRPYLIRAIYEWCVDRGHTPHIAVRVDRGVQVPLEYVQDGQIVLNIAASATQGLHIGNDLIRFQARFGGVAQEIMVPIDHVLAIYARENGQGMGFVPPEEAPDLDTDSDLESAQDEDAPTIQLVPEPAATPADDDDDPPTDPTPGGPSGKGHGRLKLIK